jgi:hypothetical protein
LFKERHVMPRYSFLYFLSGLFSCVTLAVAQPPENDSPVQTDRVSEAGHIYHNSLGSPRFSVDGSRQRGVRGDLLILSALVFSREKATLGAYLYYQKSGDGPPDPTKWEKVTQLSQSGMNGGYRSNSLRSLGTWTRLHRDAVTVDSGDEKRNGFEFLLFLPYSTIGLPDGKYYFTYRIRMFVKEAGASDYTVKDDFYIDNYWPAIVERRHRRYRISLAYGSDGGPPFDTFQLSRELPGEE